MVALSVALLAWVLFTACQIGRALASGWGVETLPDLDLCGSVLAFVALLAHGRGTGTRAEKRRATPGQRVAGVAGLLLFAAVIVLLVIYRVPKREIDFVSSLVALGIGLFAIAHTGLRLWKRAGSVTRSPPPDPGAA